MNIEHLLESLQVYNHMVAGILGMPRLFIIATIAPFLGSSVVTGQVRLVLVLSIYLIIHPVVVEQLPPMDTFSVTLAASLLGLLVKETLLGLFLGFISGVAFWAVQSAGFFIDNQRGASMSEGSDILSGEQNSPTGALLFQSIVYMFYASGAFLSFLGLVYASYEFWPVTSVLPGDWSLQLPLFFAEQVGWLMLTMLMLAAPISVACLLTDIALGLVNRFASQLNVYVLAMPLKSAVAAFLLLFYFPLLVNYGGTLFDHFRTSMHTLKNLL